MRHLCFCYIVKEKFMCVFFKWLDQFCGNSIRVQSENRFIAVGRFYARIMTAFSLTHTQKKLSIEKPTKA